MRGGAHISPEWQAFLDKTKLINRYHVGIYEGGGDVYTNRDRVMLIKWRDESEHFDYQGWSTENKELHMEGSDSRLEWIKTWLEEKDTLDEAQINAWRALTWMDGVNDLIHVGNLPKHPHVYFYERQMALADIDRGKRLT